jgi:uncharacterized repeat protein (TIGR01451 family)
MIAPSNSSASNNSVSGGCVSGGSVFVVGRGGFVWRLCLVVVLVVVCGVCGSRVVVSWVGGSAVASAAGPAASLRVSVAAGPTVVHAGVGRGGEYSILVENVGGAATSGEITVRDRLPAGLSVTNVNMQPAGGGCSAAGGGEEVCSTSEGIIPGGFIVVDIFVVVTTALVVGTLLNRVVVTGGGSAPVSNESSQRVGGEHETGPAGVAGFSFEATGPAGERVSQAGAHPTFLTTTLLLNSIYASNSNEPVKPVEAPKDLEFYLPLGLLGDPTVSSLCPVSLVETNTNQTGCPPSSRVGTIAPMILSTVVADTPDPTHEFGIYNVVPEKGYAAEFAFAELGYTFVIYAAVVRHDGQYMLRVSAPGLPEIAQLVGLVASFDGDINERYVSGFEEFTFDRGSFLTDPSDCGESASAREASVLLNTWEDPDPGLPIQASTDAFPVLEGCELLKFSAGLGVRPETTQAAAPSGYEVGLEVPQAPKDASGLGTPPVKNVELRFPEGTTISPSSANGLVGCEELGPSGIDIEGPESEAVGPDGLQRLVAGHCPAASQIGTVSASTPLLREGLSGHLFIAQPHCGGAGQHECTEADARDGELFGVYIEIEAPNAGVVIKLKGSAQLDPVTGRITAVFDNNPQFPFSKLTVTMKSGPRAPLANPQACGAASSEGVVAPWSEPQTPSAHTLSTFTVDWDGAGGACPASLPFAPSFTAGTASPAAGAFSSFALVLKREDREQDVQSLSTVLPEGLLADVAKVGRCPEPLASEASLSACPASSQIGTITAGVGSGSEPYYVTGKVFFTGPYGGAPFGLSVVVPASAGPFNLGNVIVRVALFVDPHTARVTAVSTPLPQKIDGVPLHLRTLDVSLDAHEFTLNPTGCSQRSITGVIYSTTGANASVASPFAAAGCKNLAFKPVLSGSTEARATKARGVGVKVKIAYPSGGAPESNIAKVVIGFPSQLPVRLETLQQACRAVVFEANPANCPSASDIGSATVHTPILGVPLVGPAYLVSYGSAKFPDVVFVLQGEGVTLDVDGQSFVSHAGALKVTVASVPDAPFSTFETSLPAGRYSQFTSVRSTGQASGSQCGESLAVPVTMVSQAGTELKSTTKLQVTGCKASRPRVSLGKAKASVSGVVVTVKTSARGRVSLSASGLKGLVKSNVGAGTHRFTLAYTTAGKSAARAHRKVQLTVGLTVGKQKASGRRTLVL